VSTLTRDEPAAPPTGRDGRSSLARLLRLHLTSRRVPAAVLALAVCAPLLQWAVRGALSQSDLSGARASAQQLSLLLEAAAATIVSAALHGPFGESERIAGRRLPLLWLATALLLTAVALAVVYVGVLGTAMPSGELAPLRDTAGLVGIGILCTVLVGGHFAWVGPVSYWVLGAYALTEDWHTPWTWPGRPGGDLGANLCAYAVLGGALLAVAILGPRQLSRD
jgi:hypothetical protein